MSACIRENLPAPWRRPPIRPPGHAGTDRGDTLVEVLIAVVIIAVTVFAIGGAFVTIVAASGTHRTLATEETVLRAIAEDVVKPPNATTDPYLPCASEYAVPAGITPNGFTTTITLVGYWNGLVDSNNKPEFQTSLSSCSASPPTDDGLQEIKITESEGSGPSESIYVLKAQL